MSNSKPPELGVWGPKVSQQLIDFGMTRDNWGKRRSMWPDTLASVLAAAAIAPGNRSRFLAAGLIDQSGGLVADWAEAFARLAPLSKADVRSQPGEFLARADDVVYRGQTSGTESTALTYFAGDRWNQLRIAARSRSFAWWGIAPEIPILNLASRLSPVRSIDQSLVGPIDADFLARLYFLVGPGPIVLRGYPSRLCEVAQALQRVGMGLPTDAIVAVVATGECLFESQRSRLGEVFRSPMINEYGCQETGISGMSCPEVGRLHLDEDRALYELIDGELVTTDLANTTMPMVRYSCGDRVEFYGDPCPCGRSGLTAKILGRAAPRPPMLGELEPVTGGAIERSIDSQTWVQQLSEQPWSLWLSQPLPTGEAQSIAELLKQLIAPRQIILSGLPAATVQQIEILAASEPAIDDAIEALKIRVLLWAIGRLTAEQITSIAAQQLYQSTVRRWEAWAARSDLLSDLSAIGFDLLAPLLTMDRAMAQMFWELVHDRIEYYWPQGLKADALTMHHYLNCLEQAGQSAQLRRHPWMSSLRPLAAVLLGDFLRSAATLDLPIVTAWAEMIHACPGELSAVSMPSDRFRDIWLRLRQAMLLADAAQVDDQLSKLFACAASPAETAQCWLEKGYITLLRGESLDPIVWVDVLKQQIGLFGQTGKAATNPTAWVPILQALAPQLAANGQPGLAYACLFAAAPPNRYLSNFDRQTKTVNSKQFVNPGSLT
jgi:phenylacetate-CoA ligase